MLSVLHGMACFDKSLLLPFENNTASHVKSDTVLDSSRPRSMALSSSCCVSWHRFDVGSWVVLEKGGEVLLVQPQGSLTPAADLLIDSSSLRPDLHLID